MKFKGYAVPKYIETNVSLEEQQKTDCKHVWVNGACMGIRCTSCVFALININIYREMLDKQEDYEI